MKPWTSIVPWPGSCLGLIDAALKIRANLFLVRRSNAHLLLTIDRRLIRFLSLIDRSVACGQTE
jgi:hypothetical protein